MNVLAWPSKYFSIILLSSSLLKFNCSGLKNSESLHLVILTFVHCLSHARAVHESRVAPFEPHRHPPHYFGRWHVKGENKANKVRVTLEQLCADESAKAEILTASR